MELVIIKISVIIILLAISFQDIKERKVFLWLFLLSGALLGTMHYLNVFPIQFFISIAINIFSVGIVIGILALVSKFLLKKKLKDGFGLGDALFFMVLAISFPTVTFLVLFSFSLMFALISHIIFKNKNEKKTVPLAGLQAIFVGLLLCVNWIFDFTNLYTF